MTQLLISVTSVEEAQLALDNGADIIDLKDPAVGALGALPLSSINNIVGFIRNYHPATPVSATIGDLPMEPKQILEQVNLLASTKVDFIKIGFFEAEDYQECLAAFKAISGSISLVAVLFAEYKYPLQLVEDIKHAGFKGLMLDTAHKNGRTVLYYHNRQSCEDLAVKVIRLEMSFGLAGSLKLQDVTDLKGIKASFMGFRSGACKQDLRSGKLEMDKIRALKNALVHLL